MTEESQELFEEEVRRQMFVIMDNNGALLRAMTKVIKDAGIGNVVSAESAKEGFMVLNANREVGVVLFSDNLPDMEATKLIATLTGNPKFQATTLIEVSNNDSMENIRLAIAGGVDGYVVKPFALLELKQKIEEAMKVRKRKIAMKNLRLKLDLPARVILGRRELPSRCLELAKTDCIVLVEDRVGMGEKLMIRLPKDEEGSEFYDPIPGSVASASRNRDDQYEVKISFTAKPAKSQGIMAVLQANLDKM